MFEWYGQTNVWPHHFLQVENLQKTDFEAGAAPDLDYYNSILTTLQYLL